jgi:uncharacterized protein with PIN domain
MLGEIFMKKTAICTKCGEKATYTHTAPIQKLTVDGYVKAKARFYKCTVCKSKTWRFA